ncbi:alpha-L-rhamnosidase-related protein [Silvibacterium acidisoli]|uniref:alpha-L-rhamnosidase-related protein n=1 Tax=Acidobacteriaceae bacterium ZG23-2 TaxID=2883246 RepID=UPI00406CB28A
MRPIACFLLCISAAVTSAQTAPHRFTADWITAADAPSYEPAVVHFRKEITLDAVPAHYMVHVSADNHFVLMVNGRRIGDGPSVGDMQHWRYETYDLAPALHAGRNVVAATVWNLGEIAPIRQITWRLGFLLEPESQAEAAIATNKTWQAIVEQGYGFSPKPDDLKYFYYVASSGERIDAAKSTWDWSSDSPQGDWKPAASLGRGVTRGENPGTNWLLVPDTLPPMEFSETYAGRVVRSSGVEDAERFPSHAIVIPANSHATLLIDRGTLTTAYPTLTVSDGKGADIAMRYAEALIDDHGNKGNRNQIEGKHEVGVSDELLPDGGAHRAFTPLDWRTWRYLQMDVTTAATPLKLESLTVNFTAYPFEHRATFSSDDDSLSKIWEVGWRTARLCAHDAYMDTPYWERLQYIGDTRIQTLISYTNTGDDRLARQAILAFRDSMQPEGITQSRYPSRLLQMIQNFSLIWVGIVHDYWYYRNDPQFVREQLPAVRSELSYFRARLNKDGLPALPDWWPFVDWAAGFPGGNSPADANGVSAAGGLFYLEALNNAAEMEDVLGDANLGREDADEAARLRKTIYDRYWSQQDELLADTTEKNHFSQQANALAVWLDVIPKAQQAAVMTRIFSATDAGFHTDSPLPKEFSVASNYFRFYLTRGLVHAGLGDRYNETLAPWRTMLSLGLSTWAEEPEPTRSDSHAWTAHPNIDLLTTIAGIRPAAPNFAQVKIAPALGSLKQLKASYPSPRGEIAVDYSVRGTSVHAQVNLPAALTGTFEWKGKSYPLHAGANAMDVPKD